MERKGGKLVLIGISSLTNEPEQRNEEPARRTNASEERMNCVVFDFFDPENVSTDL